MTNATMRQVAVAIALTVASIGALAHEYTAGSIEIVDPWAKAPPKGAPVAGAYLSLVNKGTSPDRLLAVATPVAREVQLHTMNMDGGVMKMRELPDGIEVPPGETVELKPGGLHIMLMGLTRPLVENESFSGELTFEHAGKVTVEFRIEAGDGHSHGESQQ